MLISAKISSIILIGKQASVINDLIIRDEINYHGHEMIALNKGWQ